MFNILVRPTCDIIIVKVDSVTLQRPKRFKKLSLIKCEIIFLLN